MVHAVAARAFEWDLFGGGPPLYGGDIGGCGEEGTYTHPYFVIRELCAVCINVEVGMEGVPGDFDV